MADDGVFLRGAHILEGDAGGRVALESERRVADDTDVGVGQFGGAQDGGQQQFN